MRPLVLLPALLAFSLAAEAPPSAEAILQKAQAAANASHRTVLVAFHASWCSWCRRLEATLNRPAVKEIMNRHFVIQWLTVQERGPKKELDNPGAAELYQKWTAGAKAGIPFYLVLDAKGQMVSSSIRALKPGAEAGNMGYPGSPEEIQGFLALLKDGAPALTPTETDTLTRELDAAKP
jgi:thiol-disulfide isomerase/thioredoxin